MVTHGAELTRRLLCHLQQGVTEPVAWGFHGAGAKSPRGLLPVTHVISLILRVFLSCWGL